MTARRFRHLLALLLACGLAAAAVILIPPPQPPASPEAEDGFLQMRCRLLDHHRRQLDSEASRIADEELAEIFSDMDGRVDAFADWALRWRTSYSLLRRITLGGLSAAAQGESVPDRVRNERDAMVEDAFQTLLVIDADEKIKAAALRWHDRLEQAMKEVDRDHQSAMAMYLGFEPGFGTSHPFALLPGQEAPIRAADSTKDFTTSRLARPVLVRGGARVAAVILPTALVSETVLTTSLLPGGIGSIAALLGLDYLISRIDAWVSRDAFVAEIHAAVAGARTVTRDRWAAAGRRDVARMLNERRDQLSAVAGSRGCPSLTGLADIPTDRAP